MLTLSMRVTMRAISALLCLVATAAAQTTWIVAAAGGGHFLDIPPAVAAASPGDTLLVRAGNYTSFVVSKGIRIVGENGAAVTSGSAAAVTIDRVPGGETCVVRGLAAAVFGFPLPVVARDCLGHVHLEDLSLSSPVHIDRCRQVSLYEVAAFGAPALRITDSTVLVVACRMTAFVSVLARNHAIGVERSNVTFAHGSAQGGLNYSGVGSGSGIELRSGQLFLSGGASTILSAGDALVGPTLPTPAILTLAGSIVLDPEVVLLPRWGGAPISGGASVTVRPVPSVSAAVAGQVLTVTTRSVPGHRIYLLAGLTLEPNLSLPFGDLWISSFHVLLDAAVVPAAGTHITTVGLPPSAPATLFGFQAVDVGPGTLELSTPTACTIDA